MPIYEYRCRDCDTAFEELILSLDMPLIKCTKCQSTATERLISKTSFQLKGNGWPGKEIKQEDEMNKRTLDPKAIEEDMKYLKKPERKE
jgi:putative FmdB family regulatory protein